MNDQGVNERAALDLKDFPDGCFAECVSSEAVNRFRWQGNHLTGFQEISAAKQIFLARWESLAAGVHHFRKYLQWVVFREEGAVLLKRSGRVTPA